MSAIEDLRTHPDVIDLEREFAELREREKALAARKKEIAAALFERQSKALFEEQPALLGFRWQQYTPYFNDGDPCVFGSNHEECDVAVLVDADGDLEFDEDEWYDADDDAIAAVAQRAARAFLCKFDEDDFEEMFGDHAEITVTRDGVTVDVCSHD